jgi:hypothetical protein
MNFLIYNMGNCMDSRTISCTSFTGWAVSGNSGQKIFSMKSTQAGYVDIVRLELSLLMVKGRQEGWRRKEKKRQVFSFKKLL